MPHDSKRSAPHHLPLANRDADRSPDHGHGGDPHRRDILRLLGASAMLGGVVACDITAPTGRIVPSVRRPEYTPGVAVEYATSMVLDGFATGLLVQTREGRPIKIEGNPEHPASLGATGVQEQASILGLYDPDRARATLFSGTPASWQRYIDTVAGTRPRRGLRFLLPPQSSPLCASLMAEIQARHGDAGFIFDTPADRRAVYEGARRVFGRPLETQYRFRDARVVLSLDADFTASGPNAVRWARDFAAARRLATPGDEMNRLYMVETSLSPTGSVADHRLAVRPTEIAGVAARILGSLLAKGARAPGMPEGFGDMLPSRERADARQDMPWIDAVAADLRRHAGRGLVLAGPRQPAEIHALAHLINATLGNIGATCTLTEPALLQPLGPTLADLMAEIHKGVVDTLVILECNPVYAAPPDLGIATALAAVPTTVHLSLHYNETSRHCRWFVPAAHYLESWGDARAYDGTISLQQPMIRPLYNGVSSTEVLAAFAGHGATDAHALLQSFWLERMPSTPSAQWNWQLSLQRGVVADSASAPVQADVDWAAARRIALTAAAPDAIDLSFELSPTVHDGRFANNAWLLELPQPLTKLTWDNAALMSPRTAASLDVATEDVIVVRHEDRQVRAPVLVLPGHADRAITMHIGWGRRGTERLAEGHGFDANVLRSVTTPWHADGVSVEKTGERYRLARTQEHFRLHGRDLALTGTLPHYREHPEAISGHQRGALPTLLPPQADIDPQWAMTIDTMICTGCSACMVACQAENNIAVVGKDGVENSREMHWLRIDSYITGPPEQPDIVHQPMLCQHCEHAPCEYVCPVFATAHSPDGLNEMTYNRCIGTRFCSNNCPYKVRRFNWFDYTEDSGVIALQKNPTVTVRARGVMEKCTYCVQRIRGAGIRARMEGREIRPGEVITACQQACPTGAITFGSLGHPDTPMVRWRRQPRAYAVLHAQGTRPRTKYLAKIRNPNPELD